VYGDFEYYVTYGKCFVGWHINCQCYQKQQETSANYVSPLNRSNLELSLNFFDDGVTQHSRPLF
jgi:hypothetical protein